MYSNSRDAQKGQWTRHVSVINIADTEPWKLAKTDMDRVATILNIALQLVAKSGNCFPNLSCSSSESSAKCWIWNIWMGPTGTLPICWQKGINWIKQNCCSKRSKMKPFKTQVTNCWLQKSKRGLPAIKPTDKTGNCFRRIWKLRYPCKYHIRVWGEKPKMKNCWNSRLLTDWRTVPSSAVSRNIINRKNLVGKQVLFIANLCSIQFKNGLVSEGMILSAENPLTGTCSDLIIKRGKKPGGEVK